MDVGFDVSAKWLWLKNRQLMYDKAGEDEEEEERKTISIVEEKEKVGNKEKERIRGKQRGARRRMTESGTCKGGRGEC